MHIIAAIDAMFASTPEDSRTRPRWMRHGDPAEDARYRLSILLAAPVLTIIVWTLAGFMMINPGVISKNWAAGICGGALMATNIAAFYYLGARLHRASGARPHASPNATAALSMICIACIPCYCIGIVATAMAA
jgi:hypothetical protein